MEQDLWRRAEHVFHAALDCTPQSRLAFLDEACTDNLGLRRLVETLLSHDERAGNFLEEPIVSSFASEAAGTLIGRKHGSYHFVSLLGAGGMGEVYRAHDGKLGRDVAIKTLPPEFARDPVRLARLRREARTLAALNHPNISTIHGLEESPEVNYLVLELVEGVTPRGPLPLTTVLDLGSQLAEGLQAAHDHGIVHRDLKPGNLRVTSSGRLKILDFGLAKGIVSASETSPGGARESSSVRGTSVLGRIQGTPGYMSPEQASGQEVDQRTDIWAFGCLVYELLSGRRAFESPAVSVGGQSLLEQEPDWNALPPGTPAAIEDLLRRCLLRDPNLRPNNIADARSIISEAQKRLRIDESDDHAPVSFVDARFAVCVRSRRPSVTLAIAASVLLVLSVGSLAAFLFSRSNQSTAVPTHYTLTMPGATALGFSVSSSLALAADGSGVVYFGTNGGKRQLYWHDLRRSDGWPLEGTEGVEGSCTPFLSPNGKWLGFFRDGRMLKIPLTGGRVFKGASATPVASVHSLRGAVWSADGTIIYGTLRGGLWEVPADGHARPRRLTEPDVSRGEGDHRWPALLPGGRDVLFTIQHLSGRGERAILAVLSRETGEVRKIYLGGSYGRYLAPGHLVFGRDGALMAVPFDTRTYQLTGRALPVVNDVSYGVTTGAFAFDVTKAGTLVYVSATSMSRSNELVWVTREGGVQTAVPGRRAYHSLNFALAPDGAHVATSITERQHIGLWVWNLQNGSGYRLPIDSDCGGPAWSPAGDRLMFSSNRDGAFNLYSIAPTFGKPPWRIAESTMMQRPRSWSRDGRYLAYEVQTPARPLETHILELATARSWRWGPEGTDVSEPVFSPDGRWIAYQSRESGKWEVSVRPFAGEGPHHQVSGPNGGLAPVWVGGEIYYIERPDDTRIMSRRLESTAPLRLASSSRVAFALPFALGNDNPYLSLAYAVAPGGRRVLVVRPDPQASKAINSLNVITSWSEEVRQKVPVKYTR